MLHAKADTQAITRVFFLKPSFFYRVIVMDQAWISSAVNSVYSDCNILVFFFNLYYAFAYNILGLQNSKY